MVTAKYYFILFLSLILIANCFAATEEETNPQLKIESIEGSKTITKIKQGKKSQILAGTVVQPGDTLKTGEASSATLIYPDGSKITIAVNSEFTVEVFQDGTQWNRLKQGAVRGIITKSPILLQKPKFLIRTKSAVLGVRGTDFVISEPAEEGPSKVHTLEGAVDVGRDELTVMSGKGVRVEQGSFVESSPTGISSVQSFNREEFITEFNKSTLVVPQVKVEANASGLIQGAVSTEPIPVDASGAAESAPIPMPRPTHTPDFQKPPTDENEERQPNLEGGAEESPPPKKRSVQEESLYQRFKLIAFQGGIFFTQLSGGQTIRAVNLVWTPRIPVPLFSFLSLRGNIGGSFGQDGSLASGFWVLDYQVFLTASIQDFAFAEAGWGHQSWRKVAAYDADVLAVNTGLHLGLGPISKIFIGVTRLFTSSWFDEYRAGVEVEF